MAARGWLTALCVVLASATALTAGDGERVGSLGHRSRLEVEGAKTFSADDIRETLFNELDVVAACKKDALLDSLMSLIAEKTTAGYHCAGFPDAKVSVTSGDGKIKATIEEGDRYRQGEVEVIACGALDADRIKQELTQPTAKSGKSALWSSDERASFDAEYLAWLASKVAEWAGDQGYYRAKFKVAIEPNRETKEATLKIKVIDEGPRTTFGDCDFSACKNLEELVPYLGVDLHAPLTRDLREQIVKRLLGSGRFVRVHWELGEPEKRDDIWRPNLRLEEYQLAPLLGEPLSREEAALLKLTEWVERFDESDDELLIRFPDESVSLVFAPRHGFIIALEPPHVAGGNDGTGFLSAVVMAEERVGLYSLSQRTKIDAAPPPAPIMGKSEIVLVGGHPNWDGQGRFSAGVGLRPASTTAVRRHVMMHLKLTADAALSVVRTHQAKASWDGDVVSFEWRNRRLRINSLTGQLIEQIVGVVPEADEQEPDDSWTPRITSERGQFERRLAEIETASADWPNAADAQRPLSCVGEFVCEELKRLDAKSAAGYSAVGKLTAAGLLRPFDELVCQACQPGANGFAIPQPYFHFQFQSVEELYPYLKRLARGYGLQVGNYLFPRDGSLNGLWRNGVFLLADGRTQAADDLSCQPADECGAVCALLAAEILQAADQDLLSPICARRGLRRLSLAAFRDDCGDLLSGEGFVSKCILQAAAAMRQLDAEETKALAELLTRSDLLDAAQSSAFEALMTALRTSGDASPSEAAGNALDALWHRGVSDWVEQRLKALAPPPTPAEAPFAYAPPATPGAMYPAPAAAGYGPALPAYPTPPDAPGAAYGAPRAAIAQQESLFGTYGAALPGEVPGYNPTAEAPTISDENDLTIPLESAKSVKQEVRELKWLAQAIAERLKKLEERLRADEVRRVENSSASDRYGAARSNAVESVEVRDASLASEQHDVQIIFADPKGMTVNWDVSEVNKFDSEPLTVPGRYNFPFGAVYRLKLTDIPGHKGVELYPTLELAPLLSGREEYLRKNAITICFEEADFDEVLGDRGFITKVIYLPHADPGANSPQGVETLVDRLLEPGLDPVVEADRRGTILAIVRLGTVAATVSHTSMERVASVAPAPERLPIPLGLDGYCPVNLVEKQEWRPGDKQYGAIHCGKTYWFADKAAQATFLSDPDRYSPVFNGDDIVLAVDKHENVAGRREHGAFYNDRVYLFANEESFEAFHRAPEEYTRQAESLLIARGLKRAGRETGDGKSEQR
jgi:YHS domain-containing protein